MIPKLYDEDYVIGGSTGYGNLGCNGYGFLNTCQKCLVEEKTSGVYTLEMELLTTFINEFVTDDVDLSLPDGSFKYKAGRIARSSKCT